MLLKTKKLKKNRQLQEADMIYQKNLYFHIHYALFHHYKIVHPLHNLKQIQLKINQFQEFLIIIFIINKSEYKFMFCFY